MWNCHCQSCHQCGTCAPVLEHPRHPRGPQRKPGMRHWPRPIAAPGGRVWGLRRLHVAGMAQAVGGQATGSQPAFKGRLTIAQIDPCIWVSRTGAGAGGQAWMPAGRQYELFALRSSLLLTSVSLEPEIRRSRAPAPQRPKGASAGGHEYLMAAPFSTILPVTYERAPAPSNLP